MRDLVKTGIISAKLEICPFIDRPVCVKAVILRFVVGITELRAGLTGYSAAGIVPVTVNKTIERKIVSELVFQSSIGVVTMISASLCSKGRWIKVKSVILMAFQAKNTA